MLVALADLLGMTLFNVKGMCCDWYTTSIVCFDRFFNTAPVKT